MFARETTGRGHSGWAGPARAAAAALLLLGLAACATPFRADVSRFQSQLPAPAGQTFAVDPVVDGLTGSNIALDHRQVVLVVDQ